MTVPDTENLTIVRGHGDCVTFTLESPPGTALDTSLYSPLELNIYEFRGGPLVLAMTNADADFVLAVPSTGGQFTVTFQATDFEQLFIPEDNDRRELYYIVSITETATAVRLSHTEGTIFLKKAAATVTALTVTAGTNSYVSLADANTYFSTRLNAEPWDMSTENNQRKALITATKMIDRVNFIGAKLTAAQVLHFPRKTDVAIPVEIEEAACESALALLDGVDPEMEFENLQMTEHRYGNILNKFDRVNPPEHLLAGIPSIRAWRLLRPYVRDPRNFNLQRIS